MITGARIVVAVGELPSIFVVWIVLKVFLMTSSQWDNL